MIYWAPLLIPFADWVFTRMALAELNVQAYTAQNPLLLTQKANWGGGTSMTPQAQIAGEYLARYALGHYVFPIQVTSTMRMMSPVIFKEFVNANCAPTPNTL